MAWHMNGWDGHICSEPGSNRYCIGPHSYPGDKIHDNRDLTWELSVAGKSCAGLEGIPPCIYSINAFGKETLTAYDDPPDFFHSGTRTKWTLPPATVCVWPYEAMYDEEGAKTDGRVDNHKRLELAKQFFAEIEKDKSLVFHYSNYSNPFSEEDKKRYVIVGVSRVKKLGQIEYYENTDNETKEKYAGGFVWQMNVETHYPGQGLRLPYHRYLAQPEILGKFTLVPENVRCFKYGSRHVSDDDALALIERFIDAVTSLRDLGDNSEDWSSRLTWLNSLLGELWQSRGIYPGLARVLDLVGLASAITPFRAAAAKGREREYYALVLDWLKGKAHSLDGVVIPQKEVERIRRQWKLRASEEQTILAEVLPRFDLPKDQLERILSEKRSENCIEVALADIIDNPYTLAEQFVGDNPDDTISFSRIDHGVLPSPDLGSEALFEKDDWRRLRSACVERLRYETKHVFLTSGRLLQDVNNRMEKLPEWKRALFTDRYFEVDRDDLQKALIFRKEGERGYVYLRRIYEAEREIEKQIRRLASSADIKFKSPVTTSFWHGLLFEADSQLAAKDRQEYEHAIAVQADVCSKIFSRPLSIVHGAAGTGKTTVIRSILKAIDKAHGTNATFLLLAPTGKAADRIREKTGKDAGTIHSFLARNGWLNDNLTVRREGGTKEDKITTFVIDEASMLDLEITAALFRAIQWNAVQRLIIVGDPNQLPPIGRAKVFADILDWLRENHPDSVGELTVNLRQMENRVTGKGTGILDVASVFARRAPGTSKDEEESLHAEDVFKKLQDLPPDGSFDKDLRVMFWKDAPELLDKLVSQMLSDMEADTGNKCAPGKSNQLWMAAASDGNKGHRPEYHQVLSPYLHEDFGTEAINLRIQQECHGDYLKSRGSLAGITLFDKVIQIRNRGTSDPLFAWNFNTRKCEPCNVFNGELGYVYPHLFDKNWKWDKFRLRRFRVAFARKQHLAVGYGRSLGKYEKNGKERWIPDEKIEENLELAYAISVHKAQGSEFERVYFIVPKQKATLLSPELFYTGITRAARHCTLFIQEDVAPLLRMRRPASSHLVGINSSLFDFQPVPDGFELIRREGYLEDFKIHRTLADVMVRSKSEVIIANMLFDREIPFEYERPLYAADGSFYLPDFTILWRGENYYWEHLGLLQREEYRRKWKTKRAWYEKNFPSKLLVTEESGNLSQDAKHAIEKNFA
jgi:ATP-dependent exoDNAse (exonuclease V) alpha subunit